VPILAAMVTYRLCRELSARDGVPTQSRVRFRQIPGRLLHGKRRPADAALAGGPVSRGRAADPG
jgi:hypothetical protein